MKKRARVIQISGLRGILMMAFIGVCLVAGFVGFPAICAMKLWNYASNFAPLPLINFYQGLMLWAIVAISGFIINDKKKFIVEFQAPQQLSEKDMQKLMERVKIQSQAKILNSMVMKASDIKSLDEVKNTVEKTEVKEEEKSEKENV